VHLPAARAPAPTRRAGGARGLRRAAPRHAAAAGARRHYAPARARRWPRPARTCSRLPPLTPPRPPLAPPRSPFPFCRADDAGASAGDRAHARALAELRALPELPALALLLTALARPLGLPRAPAAGAPTVSALEAALASPDTPAHAAFLAQLFSRLLIRDPALRSRLGKGESCAARRARWW
jgi:hypothetical protein